MSRGRCCSYIISLIIVVGGLLLSCSMTHFVMTNEEPARTFTHNYNSCSNIKLAVIDFINDTFQDISKVLIVADDNIVIGNFTRKVGLMNGNSDVIGRFVFTIRLNGCRCQSSVALKELNAFVPSYGSVTIYHGESQWPSNYSSEVYSTIEWFDANFNKYLSGRLDK